MARPGRLVVVTGTGTAVGKTWVTAATLRSLRARGVAVAARKPVQSYGPGGGGTDADVLAGTTDETPEAVCPRDRWYEVPMAPPMAAEMLGRPAFSIADLVAEIAWPEGVDIGIVEGVGGPRSPLASDGDTVDLVRALRPDLVVVVGDAALGVINAVRLAVAPFATLTPAVVVLNRYDETDDLHRRNREWLTTHTELDVVTGPEELVERLGARVH